MSVKNEIKPSAAILTAVWEADSKDHVISLIQSPSGEYWAAASISGPIYIFDASGAYKQKLRGHDLGTADISFSLDGKLLASIGQDGKARLWDVLSGQERMVLDAGEQWGQKIQFSPHGTYFATAAGNKLRLWQENGALVKDYPAQDSTILDIAWRSGIQQLISACYGGINFWTPERDLPKRSFKWKGSILKIVCSPNGEYIATGDQDSTVHFWIVKSGTDLQMSGYETKVQELSWDHSSRYLATGGGRAVTIWDCSGKGPAGTRPIVLKAHEKFISALKFQHNGAWLASGSQEGLVMVWDIMKEKPVRFAKLNSGISCLAWSLDDEYLIVGSETGIVQSFKMVEE